MTAPAPKGERLQKALARAGIASRRAAEELILAGRVQVNGQVVTELGTRVDPAQDTITLDGRPVGQSAGPGLTAEERVTYLLHKPLGVVSTAADPQGRPTVVGLVPATPRVYPVGRLDVDTEGLLLLSNDGDLAYRLTHPRYGVEKEYEVLVRGTLPPDALRRLREGVLLEGEERPTAPAQVGIVKKEDGNTLLRFVIHEGRKRQIRRMVGAVGGHVSRLRRVRFGPLLLGDLAPGAWRRLTPGEIRALSRAASGAPAPADSPVATNARPGRRPARPKAGTRPVGGARPAARRPRSAAGPTPPSAESRPQPRRTNARPVRDARPAGPPRPPRRPRRPAHD